MSKTGKGKPDEVLSRSTGSTRPTQQPPVDFVTHVDSGSIECVIDTVPPSNVTQLDEAFVLPERVFFDRLDDRARRAELLTALLQAKGLSQDKGLHALQASLAAIVASAEEARLPSLSALAQAMHSAIGALGIVVAPARPLDVLVLDETEISRDLVALAVESQGHIVRCAKSYDDFVGQLDERLPDLIVTEIELSNAPPRHFCSILMELLASRPVPLVFFTNVGSEVLLPLATACRARAALTKDAGLAALLPELERVFQEL